MAGGISSDFLSLKVAGGIKSGCRRIASPSQDWGGSDGTSMLTSLHTIVKNLRSCVAVLQMLTWNNSS